jgi:hypothetical protein
MYERLVIMYERLVIILAIILIFLKLHSLNDYAPKVIRLLENLNRNFYLVHVHGNNCDWSFAVKGVKGGLPNLVEIALINKSLVDHAQISPDQSHPTQYDSPNCKNNEEIKFEIKESI